MGAAVVGADSIGGAICAATLRLMAKGNTTRAHVAFRPAATARLCSKPTHGSNTQVPISAPVAAPRVFNPYNSPTVNAARSTRGVSALASNGSDAPIRNVGQRRITKSIVASTGGASSTCPNRKYRKS